LRVLASLPGHTCLLPLLTAWLAPLLQPFAPYSKSDRVGRACEWNFARDRERNRHWQRNAGFGKEGEPSPFVMEQVDEEGFHLVEQKTPAKPKWGPGARGGRGGMRGGMRWVRRFCLVCTKIEH
jgi:hypothetical protein